MIHHSYSLNPQAAVELSLEELEEILGWCEGVERGDTPWIPENIHLYRRLKRLHNRILKRLQKETS